jgi:hypothetical protein
MKLTVGQLRQVIFEEVQARASRLVREAKAVSSSGVEYDFKKLRMQMGTYAVYKDDVRIDNYFVHTTKSVPGFKFALWHDGQLKGRFANLKDVATKLDTLGV